MNVTTDAALVQLTAFDVGSESYVIDIMRVKQIVRPMPVTKVRRGPRFVDGVINLRGAVIPIIDLRHRLGLPPRTEGAGRIMIVTVARRLVGLTVDRVTEVVRIPRSALRPAPLLIRGEKAPFFLGVCYHREKTLILLNLHELLSTDDPVDVDAEKVSLVTEP